MTVPAKTIRVPSLSRLILRYSTNYRRLAEYIAGFVIAETLWFAFAGYKLQNIPSLGNGFASYAPLTKCVANGCAEILKAPPWYISPITNLLIYLLPVVCALIFVAPSLARELESNTYALLGLKP